MSGGAGVDTQTAVCVLRKCQITTLTELYANTVVHFSLQLQVFLRAQRRMTGSTCVSQYVDDVTPQILAYKYQLLLLCWRQWLCWAVLHCRYFQ